MGLSPSRKANDREDLIQIAAPDISSNAAKEEIGMTNFVSVSDSPKNQVETILSSGGGYIETLTLRPGGFPTCLTEIVIESQWQDSKHPEERRVKSRSCVERQALIELQSAINHYLSEV
jgi:hypothetical protein